MNSLIAKEIEDTIMKIYKLVIDDLNETEKTILEVIDYVEKNNANINEPKINTLLTIIIQSYFNYKTMIMEQFENLKKFRMNNPNIYNEVIDKLGEKYLEAELQYKDLNEEFDRIFDHLIDKGFIMNYDIYLPDMIKQGYLEKPFKEWYAKK